LVQAGVRIHDIVAASSQDSLHDHRAFQQAVTTIRCAVVMEASSRLPPEGADAKVITAFRVRQGGQGLDELVS
jgi:hypothetical protein